MVTLQSEWQNMLLPDQLLLRQKYYRGARKVSSSGKSRFRLRIMEKQGSERSADVYDGNLWKEFQDFNGTPFLQKPRNYGFMLNFDFFNQ